ncbi:hypothetical protein V6N13_004067 [Hibiscus sabdariffa]|uniref:TF-B3 domain-containing protein n=1 Tax=Hibiscus sabdariffa TaxID=183260 RepID=A0ABR2RY49_9ROSI
MAAIKTWKSDVAGDCLCRASKRSKIETHHQMMWLGTLKSENEAATAFDGATTIGLGTGDPNRDIQDVLNMIKGSSYQSKSADFIKIIPKKKDKFTCIQLFQKELTPSDVGKLNRLVIPKKHAIKHFPCIQNNQQRQINGGFEDIELVFYDKSMQTWRFRYCYCRSSQSFVFTRGWNRFVKEKKLRERDVIAFYTCEFPDEQKQGMNFFLIDVNYSNNGSSSSSSVHRDRGDSNVELGLNLEKKFCCKLDHENSEEHAGSGGLKSSRNVKRKKVTLFGAQIN